VYCHIRELASPSTVAAAGIVSAAAAAFVRCLFFFWRRALRHAKHFVLHSANVGTAARDNTRKTTMKTGAAFAPSRAPISQAVPRGDTKHEEEHPSLPLLQVQ